MKQYIVQAVTEVPMSRRQARHGVRAALDFSKALGATNVSLTGYSLLRGLTFVEFSLSLEAEADPAKTARVALTHFVIEAEGVAQGGESEEFALAFAEGFMEDHEHEPEALILPQEIEPMGIGSTDEARDMEWARFLSRFYNPAARTPGEVRIRRTEV